MKKRLISTLLCATMVAGCLTGCGAKSNGSGSDASDSVKLQKRNQSYRHTVIRAVHI